MWYCKWLKIMYVGMGKRWTRRKIGDMGGSAPTQVVMRRAVAGRKICIVVVEGGGKEGVKDGEKKGKIEAEEGEYGVATMARTCWGSRCVWIGACHLLGVVHLC